MVKQVLEAEEDPATTARVVLMELLDVDIRVVWLNKGWETVT